ncbi:Rho GTPase activation protein [Dendrothele bispora CBS 962.96]|uniref:Rho GTPase activation protein n=1 Tax=Dendrothele bispora (strain CBS 962.96) TaxID=1314807 RepID=A0A4S8MQ02_DENBC|nr:Rho GTPase activation protein [Dendrothele bispora CBS 962.96]
MSDPWERSGIETEEVEGGREFLGSAELFVSNTAGAALRKPPNSRKGQGKRDNAKQVNSTDDKKIKEQQYSWLALAKGPSSGHWRPATCKLAEEGERCLLNIYVDESILYQTIYIHLLNHTDIRHADTSLFLRKNCLSIYCAAGKRWAPANTLEPVYLQFASLDVCNAWMALLRSYALPEIYGRWFFPTDGGSYRMWRQVEMTIMQGRDLGNTKLFPFEGKDSPSEGTDSSEHDPVDIDVFCKIKLNDTVCGRTTTKKGIGAADWHEAFTFSELPPFENLEVVVWREKKLFKPSILGTIRIPLGNFRRGEMVEGWFPVLHSTTDSVVSDLQLGEIRLKVRVDEEIILPFACYQKLMKVFRTRNFLDWMSDFESKFKLKSIGTPLMILAVANNRLIEQVQEIATREVDGSVSSRQTLFRGNTTLTKVIEQCMSFYGKAFLEASIGPVLRRLCSEKVAIEVDPLRSRKSTKDVERSVELLIYWCREFWNQIYSVKDECPYEMRQIFGTVRDLVEKQFANSESSLNRGDLHWQSVSAFCFLRFIVPAILHPHLFGLTPGLPSLPIQRSLTLVAKVIQSMANLNASVQKEEFMRGVQEFLQDSRQAMIDYIVVVSTPSKDVRYTAKHPEKHMRTNVAASLLDREQRMPVLYKESIPVLPHMLDIPRNLAVITSAVIRSSRTHIEAKPGQHLDKSLEDFCARCFEVEEQALQRVSQLAAQLSANHRRPYAPGDCGSQSPTSGPTSPPRSDSPTSDHDSPRSPRPSTAPSDGDPARRRMLFKQSVTTSPPSPEAAAGQSSRLLHIRSTSEDSISSYGAGPSDGMKGEVAVEDDSKRGKGILRLLRR